jgi:putative ABC transport system permease protein
MSPSESPKWHRYLRFWRANVAADVDDEIAFHVDARAQELVDAGVDAAEARRVALEEFGDVDRARDTLRTMDERHLAGERRGAMLTDAWQDVRIAARSLRRSPGFVAVVSITLALGIGLNSSVYSLVDAYLFRPMPVPNGKDVVILAQTDAALPEPHEMSFPNYKDYRADTSIFLELTAYVVGDVNFSGGGAARRVFIEEGTANYFTTLGVKPLLGRLFEPNDDQGELAHPEIVLSYSFWQSHFAGDSRVVGDTIRLNNHLSTIIGVAPRDFRGINGLLDVAGFTPLNQTWPSYGEGLNARAGGGFNVFGILKPGVSLAAAREAVHAKARTLERDYPDVNRGVGVVLVPEMLSRPNITISRNVPTIAAAFMLLVFLVLAIACANVAALLLARATAQYKEQAIRAALGASRWRLARRVLIECLLLAFAGGVGASALALVAVRALQSVRVASDVPFRWSISIDGRVLVFTLLIALASAMLAGIAPVLGSRKTNLADALKAGSRGSTGAFHQRVRGVLVIAQIAVCVVIVVCAALFARSTGNASRINPGYRIDHMLMATAQLGVQGYDSIRGKEFEREVVRRVAAIPGVRSVALQRYTPFGYNNDIEFVIPEISTVKLPENGIGCFINIVTPEYFITWNLPIVEGRAFTARDDENAPKVAIVTRQFASKLWPGESAIGKRFKVGKDGPMHEVVGVSGDIQYFSIGETPKPFFFRPYAQNYRSGFTVTAHTAVDPASLANQLRATIALLDPTLPVFDVRSFDDHVRNGRALLGTRIGAWFAGIFGVLALVLASVGVYGLIAYSVAQRTREIGIRVALGARAGAVVGLVVRQGIRIAVAGVLVGVALTFGVTQLLANLLYGVSARDPIIFGSVAIALSAVGAMASLLPARRAATVDPLVALREE